MSDTSDLPEKASTDWIKNRQKLAWEPEILITGVVLIGLLQIPDQLESLNQYLNDWGPPIFYNSGMDEFLLAFLNTSVFFLIGGLIITLLMRSVWVVMIGMSSLFPYGVNIDKFRFQEYYRDKIQRAVQFNVYVLRLDKLCSLLYSLTFFLFMCLFGAVFFFAVVGVFFMSLFWIFPISTEINTIVIVVITIFVHVLVVLYLLDFLTLGWFKRFSWLAKMYRPVYVIMSFLTLAPLYRNIYYGLLSRFNRWIVFAGLAFFIAFASFVLIFEQGQASSLGVFDSSEIYSDDLEAVVIDGHYRNKNPEKISSWLHISSATVEMDVVEVFIAHKRALEPTIFDSFQRDLGHSKESIILSDSLKLAALSHFYRFRIDGKEIDPIPFSLMTYSQYNQKGVIGFIPIGALSVGPHSLELYLNKEKETKVAELVFYKVND